MNDNSTQKLKSKIKLKTDMSPEAIDRRLREVSQLRNLCLSLQKAKRLGKYKDLKHDENTIRTEQN